MSLTYWELIDDVNSLALKNWLDKINDAYLALVRNNIMSAIDEILQINTLMQIYWDSLVAWENYTFEASTELSKDTIMNIHCQTDELIEQNILMTLIKSILDDDGIEILNDLNDKYNEFSSKKFIKYVKGIDKSNLIKTTSPLLWIIALVIEWKNYIEAIVETLKEYNLDPNKKEVKESIEISREISNFLSDFNHLLLSKLSSWNSFYIPPQEVSSTLN